MASKIHQLKILPEYFELVRKGIKNFEVRKNDRDFKVGDGLILHEWTPDSGYTGHITNKEIAYILDNPEYCKQGYVILGFKII